MMTTKQKINNTIAKNRLIKQDKMGHLFKVIGLTNQSAPKLPILET